MRVRLEQIRLPANVTAGMNLLVLCSLAYTMRGTLEDPPPVLVGPGGHSRSTGSMRAALPASPAGARHHN